MALEGPVREREPHEEVGHFESATNGTSMRLDYSPPVEDLPDEVFSVLAAFLTGSDMLKLSNASPALFRDQLRGDSELWEARATGGTTNQALRVWLKRARTHDQPQSRISIASQYFKATIRSLFYQPQGPSWKSLYSSKGSLRFPGHEQSLSSRRERGGAAGIPAKVSRIIQTKSFSIDLWFALQAARPKIDFGGVLLGGQSKHWTVADAPRYHRPFIHVDAQGTLYCSITATTPVATDLKTGQWHHLMLSYDANGDSSKAMQHVYLDGKVVHSTTGARHDDMKELRHMQLGTGCVATDSPDSGRRGWYAFNGVLGSCRVWEGAVSSDQLPTMMKSEGAAVSSDAKCVWSLMDDADAQFYGTVVCVQTTRPEERYCEEMSGKFQLPGPMVPYIFRRVPYSKTTEKREPLLTS